MVLSPLPHSSTVPRVAAAASATATRYSTAAEFGFAQAQRSRRRNRGSQMSSVSIFRILDKSIASAGRFAVRAEALHSPRSAFVFGSD
jgi:hypothetical protein